MRTRKFIDDQIGTGLDGISARLVCTLTRRHIGRDRVRIEYPKNNRGGDITFHGPQQIVGYPILDLDHFFTDIHKFMRLLEEMIIRTIAEYGIIGDRLEGATGVWLDKGIKGRERKICAMGVKCSRWVTMHGFALNVNTDLNYFELINPCGFIDKGVTSMEKELERKVDLEEVSNAYYGTIVLAANQEKQTYDNKVAVVIEKNTPLPCSKTETYYTMAEGQTEVDCEVTQSTAREENPKFVQIIWKGALDNLPEGRPASQPIEVTYGYDDNKMMICKYKDVNTGKELVANLDMSSAQETTPSPPAVVEGT